MWLLQWRLQYIASPTSQGTSFEYRIYKTYQNPALKKLFIFRERRREGKRETSMCGCLLHTPNWGPGLQLRHVPQLGLNWQPLGFQADIQSMEPQQPGPQPLLFLFELINPLSLGTPSIPPADPNEGMFTRSCYVLCPTSSHGPSSWAVYFLRDL